MNSILTTLRACHKFERGLMVLKKTTQIKEDRVTTSAEVKCGAVWKSMSLQINHHQWLAGLQS